VHKFNIRNEKVALQMGGKNHFELIFSDYELIFSEDLPSQKAEKDIPMQH